MEINVNPASWLNLVNLLQSGEYVFWDGVEYPEIPYDDGDTYITLTRQQATRIDLLAYDYYGESNYFWVILLANNLDYPTDMYEGMVIRMPSADTVEALLQPSV